MRTTRILVALALTSLLSTTAACGSGSGQAGTDGELPKASSHHTKAAKDDGGTPLDPDDAMLAWSRCMREHGVDMPDPKNGTVEMPEVDQTTMDAADKACAPIMKKVTQNAPENTMDDAKFQEMLLAQAKCLRGKGYDVPDPTFNGEGADGGAYPDNAHGPAFDKAMAQCSKKVGLGHVQSFSTQAQGQDAP